MTVEMIRDILGLCAAINYAVLIVWFMVFSLGHDWLFRIHGKWFTLSVETFDAMHYGLMGLFKICILLFSLVPYLALLIATG